MSTGGRFGHVPSKPRPFLPSGETTEQSTGTSSRPETSKSEPSQHSPTKSRNTHFTCVCDDPPAAQLHTRRKTLRKKHAHAHTADNKHGRGYDERAIPSLLLPVPYGNKDTTTTHRMDTPTSTSKYEGRNELTPHDTRNEATLPPTVAIRER